MAHVRSRRGEPAGVQRSQARTYRRVNRYDPQPVAITGHLLRECCGSAGGDARRHRRLHALQAAHAGPDADRLRRRQSGRPDLMFVGEAPGADEDVQGDSVRRPRRPAADEDHRGDRAQRAKTSTSPTSSSAGRRRTGIPSRTRSRRASRFCSGRSTSSSRRSSSRSASLPRRRCCGRWIRFPAFAAGCSSTAAPS